MPQMSMWKDLASLRHFVFKSGHGMYFRRRREWFEQPKVSNDKYASDNVLWWHESYTISQGIHVQMIKSYYIQIRQHSNMRFTDLIVFERKGHLSLRSILLTQPYIVRPIQRIA